MFTDQLLEFFSYLSVTKGESEKYESSDSFNIIVNTRVSQIKTLPSNTIQNIVKTFGESLELSIGFEDVKPFIEIKPGQENANIENGLNQIKNLSDSTELKLEMQIDKSVILRSIEPEISNCNGFLYLFHSNLVNDLSSPLPNLDKNLFPNKDKSTIIIVCDANVLCSGKLIAIVGGKYIEQLDKYIPKPSNRVMQRIDYFRTIGLENLNWVGFHLKNLTPVHLICDFTQGPDALQKILIQKLLEILIVFSANRTIIENDKILAVYASTEQTMRLVTSNTNLAFGRRGEIVRLITWIETSQKEDKLIIFQNTVAREITGEDQIQNYKDYVDKLSHLLREARWNYRVYLDNKITKHFEKTEAVNEKVNSMSTKLSESIDTLTKGFVDTLLASIGVVILTLIASLAESKTLGVIFTIGMLLYAGYLFLFQVLYRVGTLVDSTNLTIEEGEKQLVPYRTALGAKKVDEMTVFLNKRKHYFNQKVTQTKTLFLVFILIIVLSGLFLPGYVSRIVSLTPTLTATAGASTPPITDTRTQAPQLNLTSTTYP